MHLKIPRLIEWGGSRIAALWAVLGQEAEISRFWACSGGVEIKARGLCLEEGGSDGGFFFFGTSCPVTKVNHGDSRITKKCVFSSAKGRGGCHVQHQLRLGGTVLKRPGRATS